MATQLPNNDRDLLLAKGIGRTLDEGLSLESVESPLIRELIAFRRRDKQFHAGEVTESEAVWRRIQQEIDSDSNPSSRTSISSLIYSKVIYRAVAAIIIIAALIGIIYFQFSGKPSLVAESGSAVETIRLADGSEVTMRPYSKLYHITDRKNLQAYQLEGEAYFQVNHNPNRLFKVEAGRGTVSVLGTKFTMSSWGNITQVFLEEGSVQFAGPEQSNALILSPGQTSVLTQGQNQPVLTNDSAEEFTDWMNNELIFDNKPVRQIFSEVEQQFNITINAPESALDITLSGSLSIGNQKNTLNDLALSIGGTFTQTGDKTYTFTLD